MSEFELKIEQLMISLFHHIDIDSWVFEIQYRYSIVLQDTVAVAQ